MRAKHLLPITAFICLSILLFGCDAERIPFNTPGTGSQAPFEVTVSLVHEQMQGFYAQISISSDSARGRLSAYNLFLSYDPKALTLVGPDPGDLLLAEGWELFDYQVYSGSQIDSSDLNFVHLYAIKDVPNVERQPNDSIPPSNELATLKFYVTNNRYYECSYQPIRFYWRNCNDNVLSLLNSDTVAFVGNVYDTLLNVPVADTIDIDGWQGPSEDCHTALYDVAAPMIDFINGGIHVMCIDIIDAYGDINVNGVQYEIADAVMFINYFVQGTAAFGSHVDASTVASDVNEDGNTLTVADLVYLIRIIGGDALPYPPIQDTALVTVTTTYRAHKVTVSTESDSAIGAIYLVFDATNATGPPSLEPGADGMDLHYDTADGMMKVIIFNIGEAAIDPGTSVILTIPASDDLPVMYAEAATYSGMPMEATVNGVVVEIELGQNYPNPFSTSTTIPLALPYETDWAVYIFNVDADTVRTYSGHSAAGIVEITWDGTWQDGTPADDGIYFYRAVVGDLTATRQMMLVR